MADGSATILDWTYRDDVKCDGQRINIRNDDVLRALQLHTKITTKPMFSDDQGKLRDAYDALLAFLNRLEISISAELIEAEPTKAYFGYWIERLLKFDRHPDKDRMLGDLTPSSAVVAYIDAYGDPKSVVRLCEHFDFSPPDALVECASRK